MSVYGQGGYQLRFDWGLRGLHECAQDVAVVAVVDVLSFTTAVTVAVERDIDVYPYPWHDGAAADFAREHDAVLAVGRSEAGDGGISLSPATLRRAKVPRVVLPSPNGSTIAHAAAELGCTVLAVSLRNAHAAACWTQTLLANDAGAVLAIAAGERWPDGSLRPAVEDLWGAGHYLAALNADGLTTASPEATTAIAAATGMGPPADALSTCASGRELIDYGFPDDVTIAAELNATTTVPILKNNRFATP